MISAVYPTAIPIALKQIRSHRAPTNHVNNSPRLIVSPIIQGSFVVSSAVEPRAGSREVVPESPQAGAGRFERAPSLR